MLKFYFASIFSHPYENREGSGSVPPNRSGSGSGRPKSMRIRIPNTGFECTNSMHPVVSDPIQRRLFLQSLSLHVSLIPFPECSPCCRKLTIGSIHFEHPLVLVVGGLVALEHEDEARQLLVVHGLDLSQRQSDQEPWVGGVPPKKLSF